ncbi:CBS domain-containing protein [Elizabethkingia anophelis]|uniref:Acetoin utilization protein n=1 Tax=Elizabethkingia anophelis TaxID=1117645 RepID=A0AAP5S259_9FLAO|nr:CBS domain-containing protein [Elizabethkingia anophelis]AKH96183.1 acetoin utilization protein [Elizabethkingia anophelis FMS-007]AQW90667.1 acetoin utilization protein [Elizabethkingia anophelis]AQW93995.1 acetoin utilization protein [Elizabethkingia anophelis]AQX01243.1 acetoin utilization protein [Elizabethkingia anophelis]KFC35886.1 acetoin utilization protein [Elizabethkingia anophelis]
MFIKEYISKDYPAFHLSDSLEEVKAIVQDFGYSHIFVKKNSVFLGNISTELIEESEAKHLNELSHHLERFAMLEDSTSLDSIRLLHTFNANVVPIINQNEKYLGYISCEDVFADFSKYPLFSENGAVLIVETTTRNYSMTEIAKIVESNNGKFYGAFIYHMTEETIQIALKISSENLSSIDETFDRYNYIVVHKFYHNEKDDLLKDRFGFLQKYMEF